MVQQLWYIHIILLCVSLLIRTTAGSSIPGSAYPSWAHTAVSFISFRYILLLHTPRSNERPVVVFQQLAGAISLETGDRSCICYHTDRSVVFETTDLSGIRTSMHVVPAVTVMMWTYQISHRIHTRKKKPRRVLYLPGIRLFRIRYVYEIFFFSWRFFRRLLGTSVESLFIGGAYRLYIVAEGIHEVNSSTEERGGRSCLCPSIIKRGTCFVASCI